MNGQLHSTIDGSWR